MIAIFQIDNVFVSMIEQEFNNGANLVLCQRFYLSKILNNFDNIQVRLNLVSCNVTKSDKLFIFGSKLVVVLILVTNCEFSFEK